jgi:hypothetical protein
VDHEAAWERLVAEAGTRGIALLGNALVWAVWARRSALAMPPVWVAASVIAAAGSKTAVSRPRSATLAYARRAI